jgi:hypothetical protein
MDPDMVHRPVSDPFPDPYKVLDPRPVPDMITDMVLVPDPFTDPDAIPVSTPNLNFIRHIQIHNWKQFCDRIIFVCRSRCVTVSGLVTGSGFKPSTGFVFRSGFMTGSGLRTGSGFENVDGSVVGPCCRQVRDKIE